MNFLRSKYIVLMLFMLVIGMPAHARALTLNEIDGKTDEQLADENWETRDVNANSGNMKCGFLSILISTVWRGYGHYCIGDTSSHYKLLTMEGVSLGMLATSLLIGSLTHDAKETSPIWKTLFHFGTTLFAASYIFDVVGTFKGDSFSLNQNHLDPYGSSVDLMLRWLPSSDMSLGVQAAYTYRSPRFWATPYGFLNVTEISEYTFGLDTGVAVWYGERTHTYAAIGIDADFEHYLKDAYKTIKIVPYIEFSLDLGSWFDHLAEFRFVNRIGIGTGLYDWDFSSSKPFSDLDLILILESGISLNVIEDLNISVLYRSRPDFSIGPISAPSQLFNTVPVPGVGIFSIDLLFRLTSGWNAALDVNFGSGVDFWFGINKLF